MNIRGPDPGWRIASGGLAWLAGVALQLQQPALWPPLHYGLPGGLAVAVLGLGWVWTSRSGVRRRDALATLALVLALAVLGFCSTGLRAGWRLADALPPDLEGRNLLVTGVVASLPQTGASGTRFHFEVESATLDGQPVAVPQRLALGWYQGAEDDEAAGAAWPALEAGDRWRLPVRLKRPHGAMNPHGFDAELWLWEQGLRATGYVRLARAGPAPQRLAVAVGHPVQRLRQALRDAITHKVSDPRLAGVLAALLVGDQAAIEREDWDLFRTTGVAHLLSISGVHVTMFAWLAGALVGRAWRCHVRLLLWQPALQAGRWGGLLAATAYALLAGWGVPAVRTLLMLAVGVLLRSAGWRWPWLLVLLLTAVVVTVQDPWALLQPGFWLSFAAVGLLMLSEPAGRADPPLPAAPAATGAPGPVRRWLVRAGSASHGLLRSQLVATLGLAPLSLVFFQQLSVVGLLANLLAIPLVTLLITPLTMLGVLVPPLWSLSAGLVQGLMAALGGLAAWPGAVWQVPAAPAWAWVAGLAGAVIGLVPGPWRVRWLALPLVLPLLWPVVPRPAPGHFALLAADVGQGTAVLVRTRSSVLLYDTGAQFSRDNDAGQRVLLPLMRALGVRAIDTLVLSHRDTDHVGGAASVMAALPVHELLSSLEPGHGLLGQARAARPCSAGQVWHHDGVRFELLHPLAADLQAGGRPPNTLSCVLRIEDAQGRSVLLAGDIEAPQEAALVQRLGARLRSTVLLVPHHGSRTSSTAAWLAAVQPEVAVVQAGYRNRFGHPAPEVLARYAGQGIAVVRTDQCGAWLWHDGAAACTRQVQRRYWHWVPPEAGADVANPAGGVGPP